MVGNPRAAERLCDDEDDSDAVSICLIFQSNYLNAFVCDVFLFSSRRPLVTLAAAKATGDNQDTLDTL